MRRGTHRSPWGPADGRSIGASRAGLGHGGTYVKELHDHLVDTLRKRGGDGNQLNGQLGGAVGLP